MISRWISLYSFCLWNKTFNSIRILIFKS